MKLLIIRIIFHSLILQKLFLRYLIRAKKKSSNTKRFLISVESDNRYQFLKGIKEYDGEKIEIIELPTIFFQNFYKHYLSKHKNLNPKHNCDIHLKDSDSFKKDLAKYHSNIIFILKFIQKIYEPDAFISASLGDSRWREIVKLSKRHIGTPWIVTEREGVIAPAVFENNPKYVKEEFNPDCDLMTVSNTKHFDYWRKIGLPSEKLIITGELKTDFWKLKEPNTSSFSNLLNPDKKTILYFAFGKTNYVNSIYFPNVKGDWEYLQKAHFETLRKLALENDDIQIVIKDGHSNDINKKFLKYKELIENKKFIILGPGHSAIDLIKYSDLIIGLQTTALIESMFTSKPIIYAGWGNFHEIVYPHLLQLKNGNTISVENEDDFFNKANTLIKSNFVSATIDMSQRAAFREQYFHNPDGNCSKRVLKEILSYLKKE